jgi:hypothetical protein
MFLLELQDRLLDPEGQLAGMPVGPAGAVRQPRDPAVLVPTEDLVASLAGDLELPTQPRHLLPVPADGPQTADARPSCDTPDTASAYPPQIPKSVHLYLRNKLSPFNQEGHSEAVFRHEELVGRIGLHDNPVTDRFDKRRAVVLRITAKPHLDRRQWLQGYFTEDARSRGIHCWRQGSTQ